VRRLSLSLSLSLSRSPFTVQPGAWHYRAWWLAHVDARDAGRPNVCGANGAACDVVKIVHEWREPLAPIVAVYSNLAAVELFFNNESVGTKTNGFANWTEWKSAEIATPFAPGTLRAVGYDAAGAVKASDSYTTPTEAAAPAAGAEAALARLALSVDVPSLATGTGTKLLLDGADTALLRLSLVDEEGRVMSGGGAETQRNVTFSVVSGPGVIVGVGNGDPTCHEGNKQRWRTTYHGLARVVVRTAVDAARRGRARRAQIDVEGGVVTSVVLPDDAEGMAAARASGPIVVEAACSGCAPARASIDVSVDVELDGVLAVAARSQAVQLVVS